MRKGVAPDGFQVARGAEVCALQALTSAKCIFIDELNTRWQDQSSYSGRVKAAASQDLQAFVESDRYNLRILERALADCGGRARERARLARAPAEYLGHVSVRLHPVDDDKWFVSSHYDSVLRDGARSFVVHYPKFHCSLHRVAHIQCGVIYLNRVAFAANGGIVCARIDGVAVRGTSRPYLAVLVGVSVSSREHNNISYVLTNISIWFIRC